MRLLASVLMIAALAPVSQVTTFAQTKVLLPLTVVDNGLFTFLATPRPGFAASADLAGDAFAKQAFGLNHRMSSTGQFDVVPGARCANGMTGRLVGTMVEPNGDSFNYTIENELCPSNQGGWFSASGTYKITGGTGTYRKAKGTGLFEGLADFNPPPGAGGVGTLTYKCLLFGTLSY